MDTGEFTGFDLEVRDPGIAWFQFSTPERLNGMTTAIKRDLIEAVTQAQMDNRVRVLVFTGTGRAFCAGDDLKAYRGAELGGRPLVPDIPPGHDNAIGTYNGLRTISQQLNTVVRSIDKLTIAAVNGVAIQTGFSLALSCDFRIAADSARLGSATLRFGLLPDEGGQYLLVQTLDHVLVQGVHPVRAVDGNHGHAVLGFVGDGTVHASFSSQALNRGSRFSRKAATPSRASGWWSEMAVFAAISSRA